MAIIHSQGADFDVEQAGQGPDLLLLHSLLTDRRSFAPLQPSLSRSRRVTLLSLPGFDRSTPAGPAITDFADRVAALLPVLSPRGTVDVLANGFGGTVAVALAARHGARVGKLVLADVAAWFPEPAKKPFIGMAEAVAAKGMGAIVDVAVRRIFPAAYLAAHPAAIGERRAVLLQANPGPFAAACRALAQCDLRPALPGIANPTLVVVGALDEATPVALGRDLSAGIPGSRFVEIPGCGHCPPLENPAAFLAVIRDFLGLAA
ncbi:MAG: hypothetical protein NVSMB23_12900 [Myxococcales bacterium]